jgi:Asp-tRNA(Asn)/Glu-tRNA(Gln) amidotransferase A subunit family amidase
MTQFDVLETTIDEVHAAMDAGEVTSRELTERYLDRIDAYDRNGPELNGVVTVNPDAADRAAELDREFEENGPVGPLHGIPTLVKDQAETAGLRTTFGSVAFSEYVPEEDATLVKKLKAAGAVVLGKTNLPDWATSWFGFSSSHGRTKNPYALDRDPGGSSAGTGAGVAANLATVGIGEDTGGSIRVPSAYCNLYGIRVTTGLVSRTGFSPLVVRQDTPGPMARTVRDMATLLDVVVGYDPEDEWTAATELTDVDGGSYTNHLDSDGLDGARIGVLREAFGGDDNPDAAPVNDVMESAMEYVEAAGADLVDPVSIPNLDDQLDETMLYVAQSKHDLNQFLESRDDAPVSSVREMYETDQYHELMDLFEAMAEDGPDDPADFPGYWRKVVAQEAFRRDVVRVHAEHDLDAILFPNVPVLPPTETELREKKYTTMNFPTNTIIASQTLCPGVSMPGGFTDDGLPVGVELLGKPHDEPRLVEMAYAYERVAETRAPPETAPALEE